MSQISATIRIDFETDVDITQEQFQEFVSKLKQYVNNDVDMSIYDIASECGFECDSVAPVDVEEIDFE